MKRRSCHPSVQRTTLAEGLFARPPACQRGRCRRMSRAYGARIDSRAPFVFHSGVEDGESLRHHCGIVGISSREEVNLPGAALLRPVFPPAPRAGKRGLAYQRRGRIKSYRSVGMVTKALSHYLSESHPSRLGIGHVRYSTHGTNKLENAQPIVVSCSKGEISLAHNGNISNSEMLQKKLIAEGSIFQSTSDTELLLHMIARSRQPTFHEALLECLAQIEGAYCFLMMHGNRLYAVRDPHGFRPLVVGTREQQVVVASETCALDMFQAKDIREVEPGEMLIVEGTNIVSEKLPHAAATATAPGEPAATGALHLRAHLLSRGRTPRSSAAPCT